MTTLQPQEIVNQRYQLERQLGQNAGRETWLAKDLQKENELVVVKLLAFGGNVQWEDLKLFEREANVLKQLNHPRIPKYRDYFSINDRSLWFGLVQEYIQGDSLREHIARGHKFNESQVKKIAIAVLEILIYLHELSPQVLHRDIKPSNLILTGDEGGERNIYLVDFGAVQDKAAAEGKSFTVVGTYGYAPMEQYGGRAVAASDLYSLGATLIYLLTGISPADLPQDDDARILFSDRTSASPHLLQWIQKLVEPTVKKRYASARTALQSLSESIQIFTPQSKPTPLEPIKQSSPAKSKQFPSYIRHSFPPDNSDIQVSTSATCLKITIPPKILTAVFMWVFLGLIIVFAHPILGAIWSNVSMYYHNSFGFYVIFGLLVMIFGGLILRFTIGLLETVTLKTTETETLFEKSLFGRTSWQIKLPTTDFQGAEPKWRMIEKRNSGIVDNLIWLSSDHNEDNSIKANVLLWLNGVKYPLANNDIRSTEVSWLIDVIEEFLYYIRRK
jgi:serine/threonine protein kinase